MKVIHVIDSLMVGGAEKVLVDQTNLLHSQGWNVSVLVLGGAYPLKSELAAGISFYFVDRKSKTSWKGIRTILKLCQRNDVVHVHMRHNFRYLALIKLLFFKRFKIIHQDHFGDIDSFRHVPFLVSFLSRFNPWYIGVSQNLTDWAKEKLNLPAEKVLLLPNIVRIQHLPQPGIKIDNSNRPLRLLVVANFREAKNHSFVFNLAPALYKRYGCIEIHCYGQILDRAFYESLVEQTQSIGINKLIFFHTDCKNIQPMLQSFDLAIHPALRESGPLVLIEYLGHGLPFVAFKTGQVAQQVARELPEFFLDSFEFSVWFERIKFLMEHRDEYGIRMKESFRKNYSEDQYIENLERFYLKIMDL